MHAKFAIWLLSRYAAQSKTVATEIGILGVDVAGSRTQVAPVGSGTSRARPPAAIRCTCVEVAVGTAVVASTQELERPFVNTVVVGGAGTKTRLAILQYSSVYRLIQSDSKNFTKR